ncbi:MAG: FAD-dependent oxidoreductase [Janthinobacterium lividum]
MAAKPVILAIDDDADVLRLIKSDLRRQYGHDYRILSAAGGSLALDALKELKERQEAVALLVVDQRMPGMGGVDFLEEAIKLYPDCKRILLTAYADTEAAIKAINTVKTDYYLLKPWDPPEEQLYPVLTDLLDDWKAAYRPPFGGIKVIGNRWSSESHRVKDFLARNQFPYEWQDIEDSAEACSLYEGANAPKLPIVVFPDGETLSRPDNAALAAKVGLKTSAQQPFYDLIIIGGGPAGLAAAVYGASEGLKTLLIEREAPGGQAGTSSRIENYLGFPTGLSGADLARRAVAQAQRFGVEILSQEVTSLRVQDQYRLLTLGDGAEVSCHALLIATGVSWKRLDIPGAEALTGAGVYYGAAMTEALTCKDDDVYMIGGANSAGQAALHFAKYARCVTLIVRGDALENGMSQYLVDEIRAQPTIRVWLNSSVTSVEGKNQLERITINHSDTGETEIVPARSLFIFIGAQPRTDWLEGVVKRDPKGFILAGPSLMQNGKRPADWPLDRDPYLLETSVPGIFVAGDVMHESVKRVASAVGGGSIAVMFIHQYLAKVK